MPQGIPERVGIKFATMMQSEPNVVLVHARNKEDKKSRYLVFLLYPEPDSGTKMELVGEVFDNADGNSLIQSIEQHPESSIDFRPLTDIPPAFREE